MLSPKVLPILQLAGNGAQYPDNQDSSFPWQDCLLPAPEAMINIILTDIQLSATTLCFMLGKLEKTAQLSIFVQVTHFISAQDFVFPLSWRDTPQKEPNGAEKILPSSNSFFMVVMAEVRADTSLVLLSQPWQPVFMFIKRRHLYSYWVLLWSNLRSPGNFHKIMIKTKNYSNYNFKYNLKGAGGKNLQRPEWIFHFALSCKYFYQDRGKHGYSALSVHFP